MKIINPDSIIKEKVAAVVILYNPDLDVLNNISSYINQVDKLFVVDNSDTINSTLIEKIKNLKTVEYICNKSNLGIAAALNIGANNAIQEGFEYLLTMDQDSEAPPNLVLNLVKCFSKELNIAIVSPLLQSSKAKNIVNIRGKSCEQVFTAWTSGNLVKLSTYKLVGGYKEDFFIDYVDHEFCMRINKLGYKIYVCNNTILKHNLGEIEEKVFFHRKVYTTNHSALRHYYRTRNRFYVKNKYRNIFPDFFKQDDKDFWRSYIKIILFEKDKLKKFYMIILGYLDFKKSKFGKFGILHHHKKS